MSSSATVLEDKSKLSTADRFFFKFESLLNLTGGVVIFLLVFLATTNVLGRWFFSLPIDGYVDWVEQAMAFLAFLGMTWAQRRTSPARTALILTSEPVFGALFAVFIAGEMLSLQAWLGGAVIVGSIIWAEVSG